MDAKAVSTISKLIYRQFPEMDGVKPKVRLQAEGASGHNTEAYLLIFQSKSTTSNGKSLSRSVRVVATPDGKILKITTSR